MSSVPPADRVPAPLVLAPGAGRQQPLVLVDVWWAPLAAARPGLAELLDDIEWQRRDAYRFADDANRFLLGAALVRLAAAARLGTPPARVTVERRCPRCAAPHGQVRLPGTGLHVSVAHSGLVVGVALSEYARVGLDVEQLSAAPNPTPLAADVLAPAELAVWRQVPPGCRAAAFLRYWTRKEAVVKATGDGLAAGLANVIVAPPHRPAALEEWPARPELAGQVRLADLEGAGQDYPAAVAALSPASLRVAEHDAADLLG